MSSIVASHPHIEEAMIDGVIAKKKPRRTTDPNARRQIIGNLMTRVIDVMEGSPSPSIADHRGLKVERWSDDDCIYMEAQLPDSGNMEADVCIHDNKIYVRIVRPAAN